MECQENLELYLNLSRRELQVLCKNNNLPANKSHTQLAKSLASFFKKKSVSPSPLKEKPIRLALDARPKESKNLPEDKPKDFVGAYGRIHFLESGSNKVAPCMNESEGNNKQHSLSGNLMTISSHVEHQASEIAYIKGVNAFCPNNLVPKPFDCPTSKTGNVTEGASFTANIQQIEKDTQFGSKWHIGDTSNELKKYSKLRRKRQVVLNHTAPKSEPHNSIPNTMPRADKSLTKGGFLSSEKTSTKETPSFQFFVMSEEGINLHVDLNSIPSEWINSLKDELRINLKMQDSNSSIFPNRTESSSEDANAHMKISLFENIGRDLFSNAVDRNSGCTPSTLSSDSENCQSVAPQPDATFLSSESSIITSSSVPVKMPGYLDRNRVHPLCATPLSDQKHSAFDDSSCSGDDNALSEDLLYSYAGIEKSKASVLGISMGPINDVGVLSSERTRNLKRMEFHRLKIDDDLNNVETNGLGNSLASIPEENDLLKSDGTEKVVLTSGMGNLEQDSDACRVCTERESIVGSSQVEADRDGPSIFYELDGHLTLDCSATEANSDVISVDYIPNHHACTLENSVAKDSVSLLNEESSKSTQAEEIETSECSLSQRSFQNNSKRSHSPEFYEEFHTKRHHSNVEYESGMMMNLRSTRTSAKEAVHEQVVRPRRSTRLLEVKLR